MMLHRPRFQEFRTVSRDTKETQQHRRQVAVNQIAVIEEKWAPLARALLRPTQRNDLRVLRTSTPQVATRSTTANTPRISQ